MWCCSLSLTCVFFSCPPSPFLSKTDTAWFAIIFISFTFALNLIILCAYLCHLSRLCCVATGRSIFRVFSEDFTLLRGVTGTMQKSCFITGRTIAWMSSIFFLVLSTADLLGDGWQDSFFSLTVSTMTGTVGLFPVGYFLRCYLFIDFLCNYHVFKHFTFFLVGISLKVTSV